MHPSLWVERCPNLREINCETASGSLAVSALKRLRFLRRASLRGDEITDGTVAMLVELPSLERIFSSTSLVERTADLMVF